MSNNIKPDEPLGRLKKLVVYTSQGNIPAQGTITNSVAFSLMTASPNIDTDFHGEYNKETGGFDVDFTYMGYPGKFRVYPENHPDGINIFIQHPKDPVCFGVAEVKSFDGIAEALSVAKNRADKDYHTGNPVEVTIAENSIFVISDSTLLEMFRPTYSAWREAWTKCVDYGDGTEDSKTSLTQVINALDDDPTPEACHKYAEENIGIECYVELADVTLRLLDQLQKVIPSATVFMLKTQYPVLYFGIPTNGLVKRIFTPDGLKTVKELGGDGCFSDEYPVGSIETYTGKTLQLRNRPR